MNILSKAFLAGAFLALSSGSAQAHDYYGCDEGTEGHCGYGLHSHGDGLHSHYGHGFWHGFWHGGYWHHDGEIKNPDPVSHHHAHMDSQGRLYDHDNDGVDDSIDHCNHTPTGTPVDKLGCSVADEDQDRVVDGRDHCPGSSPFGLVNTNGCHVDSDLDGVVDHEDDCANTPKGMSVDGFGCPLDGDADGVLDDQDGCPSTYMGALVDHKGSGNEAFANVTCDRAPLAVLFYPLGGSALNPERETILNRVANEMKKNPGMLIEVQGHTDWIKGDKRQRNVGLSDRRATNVVNFLAKLGINRDRVVIQGFGDSRPRYYNTLEKGQKENRRVEIHVIRNLHAIEDGATAREADSVR